MFDVVMVIALGVIGVTLVGVFVWASWAACMLERKLGYFMGVRVWQGTDNPVQFKGRSRG